MGKCSSKNIKLLTEIVIDITEDIVEDIVEDDKDTNKDANKVFIKDLNNQKPKENNKIYLEYYIESREKPPIPSFIL